MNSGIPFMVAALMAASAAAPGSTGAQTPIRFSGAAALALPIGDLGNAADPGVNLSLRGEGNVSRSKEWSVRGDLSWDRFSGRGLVDSYSFIGVAGNLVHRGTASRLYEFGGLGLYGGKTNFVDRLSRDDTNLGLQVGVGLDLTGGVHPTFVEFGLTNVLTPGNNSLWFPVRIGVRF